MNDHWKRKRYATLRLWPRPAPISPLPLYRTCVGHPKSAQSAALRQTKARTENLQPLPAKRARSPPPSNFIKPRNLFPDPHAKSAPPYTRPLPQGETPRSVKSSRGDLSPPVTPQALAVSGTETRSLGRPGVGSELVV